MISSLLLVFLLILLTGFFSGSETAFLSLDLFFIEIKTEKKHKFSLLYYILTKPHIFITTILIGTNITLIASSQILSKYLNTSNPFYRAFLFLVFPFITLILGEIYPKIIFGKNSYTISKIAVYPFFLFQIILSPVVLVFNLISKIIEFIFTKKNQSAKKRKNEEIINTLAKSIKKKILNMELFIEDAIKFDEISLNEIQKPILSFQSIDYGENEFIDISKVYENWQRNYLVFDKNDNFLGIINIDSIFASNNIKKAYKIDELPLIRNIPVIYEGKTILNALELLNESSSSVILTINEFGQPSGLVTKEDIFSHVSNTIAEKEDLFKYNIKKLGENSYIISGFAEISNIKRITGIYLNDDYYHTFNGYIIHNLGRIPKEGEIFTLNKLEIRIVSASKRFVKKAIVKILKVNNNKKK